MRWLVAVSFVALVGSVQGQWVEQQIDLQTGWNAVCLKVDLPDDTCVQVFDGLPVETVTWWCRSGDGDGGFTLSPDNPTPPAPDMRSWYSTNAAASTFFRLIGGESYLIKATEPVTLSLTGVPAMPVPVLFGGMPSLCGLNIPPGSNVMLGEYFGFCDRLASPIPYSGVDPIDAGSVPIPAGTLSGKDDAIWVTTTGEGAFEYAGPLNVTVNSGSKILSFQGVIAPQTLTIKNNAAIERTVSIGSSASIAPPTGQGGLAGPVVLMRAVIDWSAGFPREIFEDFTLPWSTNLAAGAELELRLLPKVAAMPLSTDAYQSLLTVSDQGSADNVSIPGGSRCLYQIGARAEGDLADQAQPTGLWIGNVVLDGVNRASTSAGVSNTWDAAAIQSAPEPFTFRIILHVDEYGVTRLMKEAFLATDAVDGNFLLASREDARAFRAQHPSAPIRRISSANFPFVEPVELTGGSFAFGSDVLTASLTQVHDDKTNPFVHAYHPEHDNKEFRNGLTLPKDGGADGRGDYESWAVGRELALSFSANDPVGANAKWNISVTGGTYEERIIGLSKTEIKTQGAFRLNKVSDVPRIEYLTGGQ